MSNGHAQSVQLLVSRPILGWDSGCLVGDSGIRLHGIPVGTSLLKRQPGRAEIGFVFTASLLPVLMSAIYGYLAPWSAPCVPYALAFTS